MKFTQVCLVEIQLKTIKVDRESRDKSSKSVDGFFVF